MSVYMGPRIYEAETSEPPSQGNPSGDLDMKNYRIVNLRQSGESRSDAATVGIVSDLVGALNNAKIDRGGGTMSGDLIMGGNKIREVGYPEDDQDVVNKIYFINSLLQTKPYDIGRYLAFPHVDKTKTFYGIRSKRNIDLDNDKVFEVFDGDLHNPQDMIYTPITTLGSNIKKLQLTTPFSIYPRLAKHWTFVFSFKPEDPPSSRNALGLSFENTQTREENVILFTWEEPGTLTYTIDQQNPVRLEIENRLNHFALEYNKRSLILWVNGISRKTHNDLILQDLSSIRIEVDHIGIVSIYDRELSKLEVVEHYVKYHVKALTDDEVLN